MKTRTLMNLQTADDIADAGPLSANDSFDIPYLPDPYARGVLFMGLPGLGLDEHGGRDSRDVRSSALPPGRLE